MGSGRILRRFQIEISTTNIRVTNPAILGSPPTPTDTALAGATSQAVALFTLAGGEFITQIKCKPTTAFTGGAVTATTIEVGLAAETDRYLPRFNIFAAVADTGIRRCLNRGGIWRTINSPLPDTTGATQAVPVVATVTGARVGDRVLACAAIYGPAAGFTEAGSTGANTIVLTPGQHFQPVVSVADQVQMVGAAATADLTPFTGSFLLESGGGLESDAAAGQAITFTMRTVAANLSALTAGVLQLFVETERAVLPSLGVG